MHKPEEKTRDLPHSGEFAACDYLLFRAKVRKVLHDLLEDHEMMGEIRRAACFTALTRPQMFAGVTYTFFVINAVLAVELFLIFRAWWVLLIALAIHAFGAIVCLREPRFFDLWVSRVRNCPRVKNYAFWQCNSYRP